MAILGMAGFGAVRAVVDFHHNRVIIGFKDWRLEARPALILGMNVLGTGQYAGARLSARPGLSAAARAQRDLRRDVHPVGRQCADARQRRLLPR